MSAPHSKNAGYACGVCCCINGQSAQVDWIAVNLVRLVSYYSLTQTAAAMCIAVCGFCRNESLFEVNSLCVYIVVLLGAILSCYVI